VSRGPSLLEQIQGLLERTYAMDSGVDDVGRFVIGDDGFRRFYAGREMTELVVESPIGDGARLLLRETADGPRAAIYFPDAMIRSLESDPPWRGIHERNVDAFAALIEELDHLLVVAERARLGRAASLFELELHANVSKHLVVSRFLAGTRPQLGRRRRLWLRHHLFDKARFVAADGRVRQRYDAARRWAIKLLDALPELAAGPRLDALRRFHGADVSGKLELIGRLAA